MRTSSANFAYANKLLRRLRRIPGIADARIQQSPNNPSFDIDVDRTRAQYVGLTERDVTNSLVVNLAGSGQVAPTYFLNPDNGVSYSIVMQTPQYKIDSLSALETLPITAGNTSVPPILGGIADIKRSTSSAVVSQYDIQPMVQIFATPQGRDLGAVASDVKTVIADTAREVPKGSSVVLLGQVQAIRNRRRGATRRSTYCWSGDMGARRADAPVLSGAVPPLTDFFHPRPETGFGVADTLRPGETIVLVPAPRGAPVGGVSTPGGTGKTQLAVSFAHAMWNARAVDLLVWVPAGNRTAILASFAQAAAELDAEQPGETADMAARRFLGWLSRTQRRWAVILDDVTSPDDLDGLWPSGETGQVLVTTRLSEEELGGPDRTIVGIPGFSMREAVAYIDARLTGLPDQRIEALDLAEDVSGLPIAMAQAVGVIADRDSTCRDYRLSYAERMRNTAGTVIDGCPQPMLATWSLAVERAHELSPAGLAWPALAFAATLDAGGIPAAVLASPAACGFITGHMSNGSSGDQNMVRSAFGNLERLGLVTVDKANAVRTVWVHPAVRAAVRAYLPPDGMDQAVAAAAAALLEAWPEPGAAAGLRAQGHS